MKNNNNINVKIPAVSYDNIYENKSKIYEENKDRSGIYRWNNILTGDSYVGSAVNLTRRLKSYFSVGFLKKEIRRNRSRISNSLLKYDYSKFSLDILEYCEPHMLIEREQHYIDTLQCNYNILKMANSHLGVKRSAETLLKFKERKFSSEALVKMSIAKKGKTPSFSFKRKINHLLAVAYPVTVVNKENNTVKIYESIRALSKDICVNRVTITKYINSNKWLKGIYLLNSKNIL